VGGSGRGIAELRERALALAGADSPERAWLLMQRGSRAALREAVSFARRSGDGRLEAMATTLLAYHELDAWEFPACEELLEQTTRMAGRPADPRVDFGCAYTRYWLGVLTGRPDPAGEGLRLMCDLAGRCRSRWLDTIVHRCTADLAAMRGDWAEARRHGEQALALLAESGPVFNHVWVLRVLLHVELYSGNLKAAARRLSALHRLKGEPGPDDLRTTLLGARITGDAGLLAPAPEPVELRSAEGPLLKFLPTPVLEQAAVAAEQRDTSKAPSYLESTRRWRGTYLDRSTDGIIGMLCDVVGRFDEAIEHFERAIALCRRAGYLPELAMTCRQYAETLVRRGGPSDLERAAGLLEEGSGLCATLGMSALGERIREQRELLAGPAVPERARTDGLTPREVEVLRLLARGFTNAEVAERLFISPLTVARHVHNLLEKTGAANRAEAVAYAARSGLVASYRTVK
jgi:DNA-binding CsgD family transcriptional regulator/tetratricopeptide (TPR) repeat protein